MTSARCKEAAQGGSEAEEGRGREKGQRGREPPPPKSKRLTDGRGGGGLGGEEGGGRRDETWRGGAEAMAGYRAGDLL